MKNALFLLAIASWEVMVRLRKGASNFVKVVSLAFVVLSIAQAAFAEAERTPSFELVTEYIRELGTLERFRSRAEEDTVGKRPQEMFLACINYGTASRLELQSQIQILSRMDASAQVQVFILNAQLFKREEIDIFDRMVSICSTMLAGPQQEVNYGEMLSQMPKMRAELEYIEKALFEATPLLFSALIDQRPDSQNHMSHLVITREERNELIRNIDSYFGGKLDAANQNYTVSSASVLKAYLKKGYKCSDEPW